jgi:sugar lactone lactonase YvrE
MNFMNKPFTTLIIVRLGTILFSISAHASELAFDAAGNLFWADGPSIFKFTPDGEKSTFATGLKNARNLAFDSKGDLFASDSGQKSIFKFTPDGKKSILATAIKVFGMVIDRSDNLYVSDRDSILKFTADGNKSTFTTGITAFEMAIDRSGNLYFSEGVLLLKFTPEGTKSTFASGLSSPWGLAVDGAGNLFVAEQDSHSILKFGPDATKSTFASGLKPFDMAIDRLGNLFVWDGESHSILKFTPDGTKSTFARPRSPDQKWEHVGGDEPKIVKAGTNEVALDLSDSCSGSVDWAPDSKRFACYSGGGGRSHTTFLFQLRGDGWKELKEPIDAVYEILNKAIAAQVKKRGLPKKTDLRLIWETVRMDQWIDSNTAIFYGGLHEVVRENPETRFDVDFLFTLKFDEVGNWKIVKTHRMSEKEIEEHG